MERVISLINEKNHYLEKFYSLNEKELENFVVGNFNNIETFYNSREKILQIIQYIDSQLDMAQKNLKEHATLSEQEFKRAVKKSLDIKDEYVSRIIEQDLQVLSCIESAKSSIIKELQTVYKTRKGIGGYKAPDFQKRVSEEA